MSIDIERLEVDREHWNGVFPEAGTICEYQLEHDEPHDEWSRCVIEFVGNRYVVAKCWPDETMPELEQCFTKREVKFRPLKSKQERQREELADLVRVAYLEGASSHVGGLSQVVDALIADGWKKEPKP